MFLGSLSSTFSKHSNAFPSSPKIPNIIPFLLYNSIFSGSIDIALSQ